MQDRLFSPHWYRIASLKPTLCQHCKLSRHQYRGETWYLLQDRHSGRHHRFNSNAYHIIAHLDGIHTIDEVWHALTEELGDDAPNQDDIVQLLGALHQSDLLAMDMTPDIEEILHRKQARQLQQSLGKFKNPLSIRIPLFDPDVFLTRWYFIVRLFFTRTAAVMSWLLIGFAGLLAIKHWTALVVHAQEITLNPQNFLLLLMCYPIVKALHELGHAFAMKHFGANVHEVGIILMALAPIPYVDASEASLFKSKQQRMIVSGAGIFVELLLSALALYAWLNLHDGIARDIAFTVMVIGGVSTLLFNGNPLLRFDGYYVLADAIEFPDLGKRANKYYLYLFQHYLFGIGRLRCPAKTKREHLWLAAYGLGAFAFRLFILMAIAFYLISTFFIVGVMLALWAIASQVVLPIVKGFIFLLNSPSLQQRRQRAISITLGIFGSVLLLTTLIPIPFYNLAPGVLWLPEQAYIRAEADGFIEKVLVEEGQYVDKGTPLIILSNPSLVYQARLLKAKENELRIQYAQARETDLTEADILQEEIETVLAEAKDVSERIQALTLISHHKGRLVIPNSQNLEGQYVRQGDSLAYLFRRDSTRVRAVVPQTMIALVRERTQSIAIRLPSCMSCIIPATIEQEIPSGLNKLPSKALGYSGGGSIATDPKDAKGLNTLETHFQFELRFLNDNSGSGKHSLANQPIGQRAYVRFDFGWEPLAVQWYRIISQMLLTELEI